MQHIAWEIVTTEQRFAQIVSKWHTGPLACDTETHPDYLLGVALSDGKAAIYVPVNEYDKSTKLFTASPNQKWLTDFLQSRKLVGHNFTYDKTQIKRHLGIDTEWTADTRIMWHLASAPSGPRPYGLKDAQIEVLGYVSKGDVELSANVKKYGGSLRKGEHYLADTYILAKYACLDVLSTYQLYVHLYPFFKAHDYWHMLCTMMEYNTLLETNTQEGVEVDVVGLQKAHERLLAVKEAASKRFHKELKDVIGSLERDWADRKAALYKREYNKTRYLSHPEEWKKFNLNSDKDKRELFYDKLGYAVLETTESGQPSVGGDVVKRFPGSFVEAYLKYEHANTLTSNFSGPYLDSVKDGRLHPGFNICGTVSYRLSGFKPYLLNAPFDERSILKNLKCSEGHVGVHADLSAIEPTITAHYSEDPSLLKVFRDGLGDIYLDLALELFPNDKELHNVYSPNVPIRAEVKRQLARQRKVAKFIQLAVQYTGTGHTVSKNLSKEGIPTTVWEANRYVNAYWTKFAAVANWEAKLRELNRREGLLRNAVGRIIRVPDPNYKDLSNRFIQSSAHDVLVLWVLRIYRLCSERGIDIKPVLLDCHDSTSNQVPVEQEGALRETYVDALAQVNAELGLAVTIKMEMKRFTSLAGLKGEE